MDIAAHSQTLTVSPISGKFWAIVVLICTAGGMAGAMWGWPFTFAPLVVTILCTCVFKPDWGLYFLMGALFFPYAITTAPTFYPADVVLFLVVVGFWLQRARDGKLGLIRTPLDLPIAVWLGIMALSLVNAHDVTRGIINWLRHVQLFLLFYAIAGQVNLRQSRRLVELMIFTAAVVAAFNIVLFIQLGGTERVYGVTHATLVGLLSACIVYLTALACFERNRIRAVTYFVVLAILFLGQVAGQSRWGIVSAFLGMAFVIFLTWKWSAKHSETLPRVRALILAAALMVILIIVFVFSLPLLEMVIQRFEGVGNSATSVNYRLFIWEKAWQIYIEHPILGIGLGQVQVWQHIFPSLRLEKLGSLTFGLGTHHTLLKYMVETGTLGTLVFLWFLARVARLGTELFRRANLYHLAGHIIGVLGVISIIFFRLFTEGRMFYAISGMTTVLFFGFMLAAIRHTQKNGQ